MKKPLKPVDSIRLKRLHYRSWHRGCKETDLLMGRFAQTRLEALSAAELDIYERLLEESDADIWSWLTGQAQAPQAYTPLLALFRDYAPD